MIAAAVAKITSSKAPAGAESAASDAAATGGIDFAALLAAQFQGKDANALSIVGVGGDVPLRGDGGQEQKAVLVPDALAGTIADPALETMAMMPSFAPVAQAVQQDPSEIKLPLSARFSDDSSAARKISSSADPVEVSTAKDLPQPSAKESVAEFAAGGKFLPSSETVDAGGKLVDAKAVATFKLSDVPAEAPRIPDAASAVSAIMSAGHSRGTNEINVPVTSIKPQVGAPNWGDALGQKVVWMAGQQHQVAELHLNPPNLGPMEVRLTISNDQVSAIFVSHQPAVREAIEAAMPRLREMFADSGMMLGNAMVSSDSLPQHQNSGQEKQPGSASRSDFPLVDGGYAMPVTSRGVLSLHGDGTGVVDLFA